MANIEKITLPNGDSYDLVDTVAREIIVGRNLIVNTLYPDVSTTASRPRILGQDVDTFGNVNHWSVAQHGARLSSGSSGGRLQIRFGTNDDSLPSLNGLQKGCTYTFSFDAKWRLLSAASGLSDTTSYDIFIRYFNDKITTGTSAQDSEYVFGTITQADKGTQMTGRCEFTFTVPNNVTISRFSIACGDSAGSHYTDADYIELQNLKLEKGYKATPWSPAPQDISSEISILRTALSGLVTQNSTTGVLSIGGGS